MSLRNEEPGVSMVVTFPPTAAGALKPTGAREPAATHFGDMGGGGG